MPARKVPKTGLQEPHFFALALTQMSEATMGRHPSILGGERRVRDNGIKFPLQLKKHFQSVSVPQD